MIERPLEIITFAAETPGKRLLVLGGVHGNEPCGPIAIRRAAALLGSGELQLREGQVTFVPVCNPRAAAENRRYVESNLNRRLVPKADPRTYEDRLGNILCPLLESCDVLLDLHSYNAGGEAFMFVDASDAEACAYAASLGPRTLMSGFAAAYATSGRNPATDPDEATGTREYALRHGAIGVTLECGQHRDPQSPDIAYSAILNALAYLGMAGVPAETGPSLLPRRMVTLERVYYRDGEGAFARSWQHLEAVAKDQIIAVQTDGMVHRAPADGVIVFPDPGTPLNEEWFYFGTEKRL